MKEMFRVRALSTVVLVMACVCVSGIVSEAHAQLNRSFVSAQNGSDANPCTPVAPCRSFGAALAVTLSGGEIIVLTSGGYGGATILQSVSIVAPAGLYAGVTSTSGDSFVVDDPGVTVRLEGLTLNSLGAVNGIFVDDGSMVIVDRLTIRGYSGSGIYAPRLQNLYVKDSTFLLNTMEGVRTGNPVGLFMNVTIEDSTFLGNGIGFFAEQWTLGAVRNSHAALGSSGFKTTIGSDILIENCLATANTVGFHAETGGRIWLSNSAAHRNGTGILVDDATFANVYSRQNNTIESNLANTTGTITAIAGT